MTNRQNEVGPTLVICAQYHRPAHDEFPEIINRDHLVVLYFDDMVEPHAIVLERLLERLFLVLVPNCRQRFAKGVVL